MLRDIRDDLAKTYLDRAASEISDYSEPEEQLKRLGSQRVLSPRVWSVDEADIENEIIADDPEGSVSEREREEMYSVDNNVLLSKILSLILDHERKSLQQRRVE